MLTQADIELLIAALQSHGGAFVRHCWEQRMPPAQMDASPEMMRINALRDKLYGLRSAKHPSESWRCPHATSERCAAQFE